MFIDLTYDFWSYTYYCEFVIRTATLKQIYITGLRRDFRVHPRLEDMGLFCQTAYNAQEVKRHWQSVREVSKLVGMDVDISRTRVRFARINSKFSNYLLQSENAHNVTYEILIYGWLKSLHILKPQKSLVFKFQ